MRLLFLLPQGLMRLGFRYFVAQPSAVGLSCLGVGDN